MSNKLLTSEKLIGLSALFVSLMTFIVFAYQTNLIRKQQYMSVYPHLSITNFHSGSVNYKFVLKNKGIGPAFIRSMKVSELNGNKYDDLVDYLGSKLTKNDSTEYHYSDLYVGKIISANEEIILFGLADEKYLEDNNLPPRTVNGAAKLRDALNTDSLKYEITYESIYGESWTLYSDREMPIKN